ncbi:MAG: BLUF domain-containing protein [Chloroflexota bacterium]
MPLVQLTYVSVATRPMSQQDLVDILQQARAKNSKRDITGMLLYRDGYFIQALEGEEQTIREIYELIEKDDRHDHVLEIGMDVIEERDFGDWSMGFADLDTSDVNLETLPGYTDFMNSEEGFGGYVQNASRAKMLLSLFRSRSTF